VKSCCPFPLPSEHKLVDIDAGVFDALRIYKPNTPLLPNICILHWNPYEDAESYLDLFLSENLLEFSSWRANAAMLVSVKQTCDRLRKLDISGRLGLNDGSDSHLISSISNLIVHLPSLERICSSVLLRDDAIVHLSTCPNLQMLRIPNDVTDFLRAYETNAPHPMLSNLVSLHTFTYDPTSFVSLLRQCHLTKLQHLILNAEYMEVHDVERLFVELASSFSHDVFQMFTFSTRSKDSNLGPVAPGLLPAYVLKHLFVFKQLRHLDLGHNFDIDDNTVKQMAASWPRMQHMVVNVRATPESCPKITLWSLISLARHCHHLSYLEIALNVSSRDLASLGRDTQSLQPNFRLENITLADSWVDNDVNPAYVSSFLKELFPKLRYVCPYVGTAEQMVVWNKINDCLQPVSAFYLQVIPANVCVLLLAGASLSHIATCITSANLQKTFRSLYQLVQARKVGKTNLIAFNMHQKAQVALADTLIWVHITF
jgi:hypothetical protein